MSSSDLEPESQGLPETIEPPVVPVDLKNCRQKGTAIRTKERDLIKSIVDLCDKEARQKCLLFPLRQATKRAALYAKVSERTIKRLRDEVKTGVEHANYIEEPPMKVVRTRCGFRGFLCLLKLLSCLVVRIFLTVEWHLVLLRDVPWRVHSFILWFIKFCSLVFDEKTSYNQNNLFKNVEWLV